MASIDIPKAYAYAEFADDTPDYVGERVTLADKIAAERAARANRWEQGAALYAFIAFQVGKRLGRHQLTYDEFMSAVVDAGVSEDAPAGDDADDDGDAELDPTRPGAGTESPSP